MFSPCANEKLKVKESLAGPENKAELLVFVQHIKVFTDLQCVYEVLHLIGAY